MEVKYREEQVITSPYVTQADKMAVSLRHLADRFLKMEPKKQCFTPEEMTEMYDRITEKVCRGCSDKFPVIRNHHRIFKILCYFFAALWISRENDITADFPVGHLNMILSAYIL